MTFHLSMAAWVPSQVGVWGPAVLAFAIAVAGARVARPRPEAIGAAGALAVAAGWLALFPATWRWVLWPRSMAEWLVLPALVLAAAGFAGARLRSRWWTVAAVCFSAWWMASSVGASVRAEFWRIEFGALAVAWVLTRVGAGMPERGLAVELALLGAVLLAGLSEGWIGVALVGVAAGCGMLVAGRGGLPPGLLMVGLVGVELRGGRLLLAGVNVVDLACLGALGAPLLVPWVEQRWRRQLRGAAGVGACMASAVVITGLAWAADRVTRGR